MSLQLGILCGGRSGEHEVSLRSADGIYHAVDRDRFDPVLVAIDKAGGWRVGSAEHLLVDAHDPARIRLNPDAGRVVPTPGEGRCELIHPDGAGPVASVDAFLPIIHGTDGEDGALQGLLRLMDVPFVGADVLGSAVGMDKDVMKRLLTHADVPVARFVSLHRPEAAEAAFDDLAAGLGLPLFVKPAALGSSVAVSRAADRAEYREALREAFAYSEKVLVEETVAGRELEVSVLGNRHSAEHPPAASRVGEIRPRHAFYSYAAKYLDENGAELCLPADIDPGIEARVQELALRAFDVLECDGMARVDFFLRDGGGLVVNEINTLPGFTPISMYPKLWEISGLPYPDLITRLVELGLERHERRRALRRDFDLG